MKAMSHDLDRDIIDHRWKKVGTNSDGCDWGSVGGAGWWAR